MSYHKWRVVPLSPGQLLDVRPGDVLDGGLYRQCETYRGGGGYDQFPSIAENRIGDNRLHFGTQFVVQLYGCHLDCPYCYVTREGVWGAADRVATPDLVDAFCRSGLVVFHLMGGSPALTMRHWPELLDVLFARRPDAVFHSDLTLTERAYDRETLREIARPRCLYAINVKGTTHAEHLANTRRGIEWEKFWRNWRFVQDVDLPAYVTFTGVDRGGLDAFWARAGAWGLDVERWREDSFVIDLIDYEAGAHVDDHPWGPR